MASAATTAFDTITAIQIDGQQTDIVCHKFPGKMCLFITQYGRINNVFVVRRNEQDDDDAAQNEYKEIVHQFGTDTDEIQSAIRHLVAKVPALNRSSVDVIISLGLKVINRSVLKDLVEALDSILWCNKCMS